MGIVVQREFTVDRDDRREFERQSRLGTWEGMRYLGSQMFAYGGWTLGDSGTVVVTNSAYVDFDHWTATRPWGEYHSDAERVAERVASSAVWAGRQRLVEHSRAHVIEFDDELSEPTPVVRAVGEPLSALAPTFGRQSVVCETAYEVADGKRGEFIDISTDAIWSWYREQGARLMIVGRDPLRGVDRSLASDPGLDRRAGGSRGRTTAARCDHERAAGAGLDGTDHLRRVSRVALTVCVRPSETRL